MADIVLRPRQLASIEGLREGIRAGHHAQMLMAGTGAGKTIMATHLIQEATKKCRRAVFICDRVQLINQTSSTFDAYGIDHGVIQASHWRYRPYERAQVCSVQTLMRRKFPVDVDLVIVDEAHTAYDLIKELIEQNPQIQFIGLSATPFTRGLGKLYTNVVNAMTTNDLLAEGWLTPLVVYIGTRANLDGVKTNSKGEWSESEVGERNLAIVGDIVSEWVDKTTTHFGGPVKTIAFSASVDDGAVLRDRFKSAGYRFEQVSYKTSDEDRDRLMAEFKRPDTDLIGLVSVEALAKGFDQADIKCGIDARPLRKSLSGHIQMVGRTMRPFFAEGDLESIEGRKAAMAAAGKPFALWLCHAGNYLRFAEDRDAVFERGLSKLDERGLDDRVRQDPTEKQINEVRCKACKAVLKPSADVCPHCGTKRERRSLVEHEPGRMERYEDADKPLLNASTGNPLPDWMKDKASVWEQICTLSLGKKHGDVEKANKLALGQYRGFYGEWPAGSFINNPDCRVDPRLESKCHQAMLQYFKRMKKAA